MNIPYSNTNMALAMELRALHQLFVNADSGANKEEAKALGDRLIVAQKQASALAERLRRASNDLIMGLMITGDEPKVLAAMVEIADALDCIPATEVSHCAV